jgi:hypothetical protein
MHQEFSTKDESIHKNEPLLQKETKSVSNLIFHNKKTPLIFTNTVFNSLIGLSKTQIILQIGQQYNDIHTNTWMFRNHKKKTMVPKKIPLLVLRKK